MEGSGSALAIGLSKFTGSCRQKHTRFCHLLTHCPIAYRPNEFDSIRNTRRTGLYTPSQVITMQRAGGLGFLTSPHHTLPSNQPPTYPRMRQTHTQQTERASERSNTHLHQPNLIFPSSSSSFRPFQAGGVGLLAYVFIYQIICFELFL